MKKAGSL